MRIINYIKDWNKHIDIHYIMLDKYDVVASCFVRIYQDEEYHNQLCDVYIQSRYRGKKLSYVLLEKVLNDFKDNVIGLSVHKDNVVVINLYKKLGFVEDVNDGDYLYLKK